MREADDLLDDVVPAYCGRLCAQTLGQLDVLQKLLLRRIFSEGCVGTLDTHGYPAGSEGSRQPLGGADDLGRRGTRTHADEKSLHGGPGLLRPRSGESRGLQVSMDPVGCAAEGDLPEGSQIGPGEEALHGALGLIGNVDLALP